MRATTLTTSPFSYTEIFLTLWATERAALRTTSGGICFVDFFEQHLTPNGFHFNSARAMRRMSSSVPSPFRALRPNKINLEFSCVYPCSGLILSMLGEKVFGPLPCCDKSKGMLVREQKPVHLRSPHSAVKSNSNDFCLARWRAFWMRTIHGFSDRALFLYLFEICAQCSLLSAYQARKAAAACPGLAVRCFALFSSNVSRCFS